MGNIKTSDILLFRIKNNTPSVLLTTRLNSKNDNAGGKLCIPGGHIEFNETPLEGGIRELKEETGIDVNSISHILKPVIYNVPNQSKYRKYNGVTYSGLLPISYQYELTPQINEVADVRWYKFDQIPYENMAFDHDEVLKYIIDRIYQYIKPQCLMSR